LIAKRTGAQKPGTREI
jgi:hypothetical protein